MSNPGQTGDRALQGLLGTIHLTKRAVEWLTKSPTVYGDFVYHEEIGYYACGAISPAQEWQSLTHEERTEQLFRSRPKTRAKCGVKDVRAACLGKEYKVVQVADKYRRYLRVPLTMPTCDHCRVLLDAAMSQACGKTGTYPDVDDKGNFVWRKVMPDRYTAPQVVGRAPGDGPKDKANEP